jgi:putative flippase GtrA
MIRFAVVGVANTLIDVGLFWMLYAPLGLFAANLLSTSTGMVFSFLMNGQHTFGASQVTLRQAVLFLATNAFTMWLLQPLLMLLSHDYSSAPLILAKVVALAGSVVVNFVLYRYVVWPREGTRDRATGQPASRILVAPSASTASVPEAS